MGDVRLDDPQHDARRGDGDRHEQRKALPAGMNVVVQVLVGRGHGPLTLWSYHRPQ
jgi:hypothetical protein